MPVGTGNQAEHGTPTAVFALATPKSSIEGLWRVVEIVCSILMHCGLAVEPGEPSRCLGTIRDVWGGLCAGLVAVLAGCCGPAMCMVQHHILLHHEQVDFATPAN
jgi:hypothetical protein